MLTGWLQGRRRRRQDGPSDSLHETNIMSFCKKDWLHENGSEPKSKECSCMRYANLVILHVDIEKVKRTNSIYITYSCIRIYIYKQKNIWIKYSRYSLVTEYNETPIKQTKQKELKSARRFRVVAVKHGTAGWSVEWRHLRTVAALLQKAVARFACCNPPYRCDCLIRATTDVLCCFDHPLLRVHVLLCAQTTPVCDVSSHSLYSSLSAEHLWNERDVEYFWSPSSMRLRDPA